MFSPFVIFLLCLAFVIALAADILSPLSNLAASFRGKSLKQVGEDIDKADEGAVTKVLAWCLGSCFYYAFLFPLSIAITFVVEPIVLITAITGHIGNIYLAYAMLGVIVITLIDNVLSIINAKNAVTKAAAEQSAKDAKDKIEAEEAAKRLRALRTDWDSTPEQIAAYQAERAAQRQHEAEKKANEEAEKAKKAAAVTLTRFGWYKLMARRVFYALPDLYLAYFVFLALTAR